MQNSVTYKSYEQSDYKDLLLFFEIIDGDFYPPLSKRGTLIAYLDNDFLKPNVSLLALNKQEIVGFINLQLDEPNINECYINTIAVKSEFRKMGVGSQLISKVINYAVESSFKNIKIRTWSINTSGLALYKKLGFITDYIVANDRVGNVDSIYLIKDIG